MADDGWIEWKGGERPVHRDTMVQVQFRGETRFVAEANEPGKAFEAGFGLLWQHDGGNGDIIAYRIVPE